MILGVAMLLTLQAFWKQNETEMWVDPSLRRAVEDGLRLRVIRGYKPGKKWCVDPEVVVEDLKSWGGACGRNAAERTTAALELKLIRERSRR